MKSRYLVFVGIGFELVGIILTTLFLGKLIDEKYGTNGLGVALLPMIGLVGWIIHVVALSRALEKKSESDPEP